MTRQAGTSVTFVDASITIDADGASAVGVPQIFVITVRANAGGGWQPAAGVQPVVTVSPPATLLTNTCAAAGTSAAGTCSVTIVADEPGLFTGQANAQIPVAGLT